MKVEPEVTFRNLSSSEWIKADIDRRVRKLNLYCPDIISCRVLLEIPHRHQQVGRRFHVRIDLTVPDEEIVVSHAPNLHAAQQDLGEAAWAKHAEIEATQKRVQLVIGKAFEIASRQLQDYGRRHRGAVKTHQPRTRGRATPSTSQAH